MKEEGREIRKTHLLRPEGGPGRRGLDLRGWGQKQQELCIRHRRGQQRHVVRWRLVRERVPVHRLVGEQL
jgi:hypothetical protein